MTSPKLASPDIHVGNEMRNPLGWMLARTKRLADLLTSPGVLRGAIDLVEALDGWTDHHMVDEDSVEDDVIFARGLNYIVHRLTP